MRGRLEKAYNRRHNSDYDHALIGDTMADLDAVLRMFSSPHDSDLISRD
jgi:hypothetical protein